MHKAIPPDKSPDRHDSDQISGINYLGEVARDHGEEYIKRYKPPLYHIKYIRAIRICKSPALGGRVYRCKKCNKKHYLYFSCGHSRCSICQSIKREQWMDKMSSELLKVPYVHLTTTMPHDFNGLARRNMKEMYNLIFRVTKETVNAICNNPVYVGAQSGMISVLHTFGSDMKYHVHVHSLLTFGGIDEEGNWLYPHHKKRFCKNSTFRFKFKQIFLEKLKELFEKGKLTYHQTYEELIREIKEKQWSLHVTHPTMNTDAIELYIARYINRIAVTNSRLKYIKENEEVHLEYNDYKNQKEGESAPKAIRKLDSLIFLNQLLQHLPPPYFQRTRRYGIHASAKKKKVQKTISEHLKRNGKTVRTAIEIITDLMKNKPFTCTVCEGTEFHQEIVRPDKLWVLKYIVLPRIRDPVYRFRRPNTNSKPI